MYAVIETGGKQYKVSKDESLKVEKLSVVGGEKIKLGVVMLVDDGKVLVGKDVDGAYVEAEVLEQNKEKKVIVYKYKAKKNERKRQGHRQPYTLIKVTDIVKA